MSVLNSTILQKAWLEGSNDYQQRIPNPNVTDYASHVNALFDPMNNDLFNQFSGLLNGIIGTFVESKLFENPLRVLKKPMNGPVYGNTERHIAVQYLKAHATRFDSETLLKVERPEYREWFYSVSDPRRYEFSWSRFEIVRAFSADGYGFDELLTGTITQMLSSANYDEMNIMLQMFPEADTRLGGLFRYGVNAPTDKAKGQELLAGIRAVAGRMTFPSTYYNHLDIPVHETMTSEGTSLVLFALPEVLANIDVYALADLFHLEKANINYRVIMVPDFGIPGVYAALAGEDFIYCRDVYVGMEPPFYNPENLTMKYYYQVAQMVGVNPAAQCCLFGDFESTTIPTIAVTPSGLAFSPDTGTVAPGGTLQTHLYLNGTVVTDASGVIGVEPDAGLYSLTCVDSNSAPVDLNSKTYVDNFGVLHVQKSGLSAGNVITITASSAYINPSGSTTTYTDTFAATIV